MNYFFNGDSVSSKGLAAPREPRTGLVRRPSTRPRQAHPRAPPEPATSRAQRRLLGGGAVSTRILGKTMRDAFRNTSKERWKRRRTPTQDPSTDLRRRLAHLAPPTSTWSRRRQQPLRESCWGSGRQAPFPPAVANGLLLRALTAAVRVTRDFPVALRVRTAQTKTRVWGWTGRGRTARGLRTVPPCPGMRASSCMERSHSPRVFSRRHAHARG